MGDAQSVHRPDSAGGPDLVLGAGTVGSDPDAQRGQGTAWPQPSCVGEDELAQHQPSP